MIGYKFIHMRREEATIQKGGEGEIEASKTKVVRITILSREIFNKVFPTYQFGFFSRPICGAPPTYIFFKFSS